MDTPVLKQRAFAFIDEQGDFFWHIAQALKMRPELGYREWETSRYLQKWIREHLPAAKLESDLVRTGFKAYLHGEKRERPCVVGIVGELDAVYTPRHPEADKATGNAHTCGHDMQLASMLGAAYVLQECNLMRELSGDVALLGIPAEESLCPADFVKELMQHGIDGAGKMEFLKRGYLEDISMYLMPTEQAENDIYRI